MEVTRTVVLPVTRDEAWEALTEPERLREWFANDVELDVRPGGEGMFRWDNGESRRAVVRHDHPRQPVGVRVARARRFRRRAAGDPHTDEGEEHDSRRGIGDPSARADSARRFHEVAH